MLQYLDWREASADLVARLYDAECDRWERALGWDYRPSCAQVEEARRAGRLPGLIALADSGPPAGWTYYMLHAGRLQIGALIARRRGVCAGLLAAVLRSSDARASSGVSCFLYPPTGGVPAMLARRRFVVFPHRYRRIPLDRWQAAAHAAPLFSHGNCAGYRIKEWTERPLREVAQVFVAAYERMPESRCFTVGNRVDEWLLYLAHIHAGAICGQLNPALSVVAQGATGALAGAVVTTDLAPGIAHIAQVAVVPAHRGQRLGEGLVRLACARARQAGYTCITLLVADSNAVARRLYDRLGFDETEEFVFAYRDRGSR